MLVRREGENLRALLRRLDKAIAEALQAPDVIEKSHKGGMRVTYLNPADFRSQIGSESRMFGSIIQKGNIKLT